VSFVQLVGDSSFSGRGIEQNLQKAGEAVRIMGSILMVVPPSAITASRLSGLTEKFSSLTVYDYMIRGCTCK
jgi:hypothetical protein